MVATGWNSRPECTGLSDANGQVHLFRTHFKARSMVGPRLDTVRRDCHVVYRSPKDADPSHFQDRTGLPSFSGRWTTHRGAGAQRIPSVDAPRYVCDPDARSPMAANCWWNTITMAVSQDRGANFTAPPPPANLVASLPYPYDKADTAGAFGYIFAHQHHQGARTTTP